MLSDALSDDCVAAVRGELIDWFRRHSRELPWRGTDDAYAVWVSEIMLQQTQVTTVIDYFERWMVRFPDVGALAAASVDEVLEMWSGLGYYRRARFLHTSARMVVDERDGRLPQTADEWLELKGVGPYTAGAIASMAHGERAPVVDGNVERVFSRLFAIGGDPKSTPNQKQYWALAERLVDPVDPGAFNQALMDLGATVCTPRSPSCLICPLRELCQAHAEGQPEAYPDTVKRTPPRPMDVATCVVSRPGDAGPEYLVVRRPDEGLLAGLWEFPSVEVTDAAGAKPGEVADAVLDDYLTGPLGLSADALGAPVAHGEVVHLFSHIRMTLHVSARRAAAGAPAAAATPDGRQVRWVDPEALAALASSTAMRKVQSVVDAAEQAAPPP